MSTEPRFEATDWAVILGASSGFGGATALELARHGMNIFGIHLDRAAGMPAVEKLKKEIEAAGVKAVFFNTNAADAQKRGEILEQITKEFAGNKENRVKVLLHSLAFGTLKPLVADNEEDCLTQAQMEMTVDVMANSIVYWAQGLVVKGLMRKGGRIYGMTSSGGHAVLPAYGAVSAAKAALESHIRQLAMELGPKGITANSIMAGVTDTPALRKIPGNIDMLEVARAKNPARRLTTPEDVAKAITLLSTDLAYFISGNVIGVDGGEDIVSFVGQKSPKPGEAVV